MFSEGIKYERIEGLNQYFANIKKYRPLSKEQEIKLAYKIQKGDTKALQDLVNANLCFVISIAKKYRNSGVSFADLISEGNVGLMRAAMKFDPHKGVKFISYAVWWIKACIQECIDEYSKATEYTDIDDYVFNNQTDSDYEEDCNAHLINSEYEEELHNMQSRKISIDILMKSLEQREIRILSLYFGLDDGKECTLDEIGQEMHLTRERVRQIKDRAIVKMKNNALLSQEFNTFKELR